MGVNWRPVFDPPIVRRELEIIRDDLHCNAVRICGQDFGRLETAAQAALELGLEVWLTPELWDRNTATTVAYIARAAEVAERLRRRWPDRLVFVVGSEFTLFIQGIVPGRRITERFGPASRQLIMAGAHNPPLNAFLASVVEAVRRVYDGPISYASLVWEAVDWSRFDIVGVDHYRDPRINDRYVEMLGPFFATGKPVVVTEFGCRTYAGAEKAGGAASFGIVDNKRLFLHQLPLVGRFIRPRLTGAYVRDEALPAREVTETLAILDRAGVDGAFVMTFVSPISPYNADPRYDLDMAGFSLVKTYADGRHGTTYPDMPWEPKEAFGAVASYFGS